MQGWTNPYSDLQQIVRSVLKDRLRRTNGCVTREQFAACAEVEQADRVEKAMLRLCHVRPDGALEWKPDVVSEESLLRKLGGSSAVSTSRLVGLWSKSRALSARTAYPHLAPSANKSQLVSRRSFSEAPVFGLDILLRPPAEFSEGSVGARNVLSLGNECFALVVHGEFDAGRLSDSGEFFTRLVVGDDLAIPAVTSQLARVSGRCELEVISPLYEGDIEASVDAVLPHLNDFARFMASAFVS
ncbi:MAG: hypothetical protein WCK21_10625 [Actinomycetota bacterium]